MMTSARLTSDCSNVFYGATSDGILRLVRFLSAESREGPTSDSQWRSTTGPGPVVGDRLYGERIDLPGVGREAELPWPGATFRVTRVSP